MVIRVSRFFSVASRTNPRKGVTPEPPATQMRCLPGGSNTGRNLPVGGMTNMRSPASSQSTMLVPILPSRFTVTS